MDPENTVYQKTTWPLVTLVVLWVGAIALIWLLPKGTTVSHGTVLLFAISLGLSFLLGAVLLAIRIRAYYRWTKQSEGTKSSSRSNKRAVLED